MENSLSNNTFRNNLIIAACALVLGVVFNYFFFEHEPGINFFLYLVVGLGILFALHRYFGRSFRPLAYLSAVILFFALMVGVRASAMLVFLNIALVAYLLLVLTREAKGQRSSSYSIKDYITTAVAPVWHFLVNCFNTLGELLSLKGVIGKQRSTSQVIKGLLMALPVVILFLWLFASADLAFRQSLDNLLNLNIPEELLGQIVIIGFVTLASLGALAYVFKDEARTSMEGAASAMPNNRMSIVQISVFLGTINVLFLIFILFQVRYLFGGESNITQQGFTFAEYAHRGFFELIAVAIISLVLIMAAERQVDRLEEAHAIPFKILSLLLIAGVIIIMASAFKRLDIYQEAYGFTILRFYVSAFIIWLSLLFVAFGYKIFNNKADRFFARVIFIAVIVFVAVMNILNPEAIIARQNIKHFARTGKLDTMYLNQLSADAVPALLPLLDHPDQQIRQDIGYILYETKQQLLEKNKDVWQEANLARARARNLLNNRASILEPYKEVSPSFHETVAE